MSKLRIFTVLLLCVLLAGCATNSPDLRGSWLLVSSGGQTVENPTNIKSITKTHFAFGMQTPNGAFGGGGTWQLIEKIYTESVEWHSNGVLVGKDVAFDCRVEGDVWFHSADFVADGERYHIDEVWERVRPEQSSGVKTSRH